MTGVLFLLLDVGLLVAGIWLLTSWRGPVLAIVGVVAVLLALELRPRLGRYDPGDGTAVAPTDAPALWDLVRRTAAALEAPVPDRLLVGGLFNAWCGRDGWRRRSTLYLGIPLWVSLDGPAQVALLGHELGHLVNRDPRRGVLTSLVSTTCARLAISFTPDRSLPLLVRPLLTPFRSVFVAGHRVLIRVAARDGQRSEYLADALAARAGGSAGAVELLEALVLQPPLTTAVERAARSNVELPGWRVATDRARTAERPALDTWEERSRRPATLSASHPPSRLRLRVVRSWPPLPPAVEPAPTAVVDAELAPHARRIARQLDLT